MISQRLVNMTPVTNWRNELYHQYILQIFYPKNRRKSILRIYLSAHVFYPKNRITKHNFILRIQSYYTSALTCLYCFVFYIKLIHYTPGAIMTTVECRQPRQLFPLEVGEDNSKFEPKKIKKNSNPSIWSNKMMFRDLRHAESKCGLCFVLTLLLHRFWQFFRSKHMTVCASFP